MPSSKIPIEISPKTLPVEATYGAGQNIWLALCFFLSCYFYGAGLNPVMLAPALLGPLCILLTTPSAQLAAARQRAPLVFWACWAAVGLLAMHHLLLSRSPDTSFIPSLLLACLPLWVFTSLVLKNPRGLWLAVSVIVFAYAATSAVEFLLAQQRAHAPLRDPANYASLLYLVGLPWLLISMRRSWSTPHLVIGGALTALYMLALLATHLRFAMLLVAGVPLVVGYCCWRFRVDKRFLIVAFASAALAFAAYYGLDQVGAASAVGANDEVSEAASPRLMLWEATWRAVMGEGGLNGTGLYTFTLLYPQFRSPLEQMTTGVLAHNDLLQLLLEGGIWLSVPMLLFFGAIAWSAARRFLFPESTQIRWQHGLLLALSVAVVHALVNFVFYVLPLVVLVGIMSAIAFSPAREDDVVLPDNAVRHGTVMRLLAVSMLVANMAWLALDITTFGVLSEYRQAPGASYFRQSEERMLGYTRLAQTLNSRRALPIHGEAKVLEHRFGQSPSVALASQVELAYTAALEKDAWNPMLYVDLAAFQDQLEARGYAFEDRRDQLLRQALQLNPAQLETNYALLARQMNSGADRAELVQTLANVATWCERIRRHPSSEAFLSEVAGLAETFGAEDLRQPLASCMSRLGQSGEAGRQMTPLMEFFRG